MKFSEIKNQILQLAKEQEVGTQYRYNCFLCGDTRRRLYVKKEFNQVLAYCHNGGCLLNKKGIVFNSTIDLKNIRNYLSNKDNLLVNKNKAKFYDLNLISNIPKKYVNYLLKYLTKDTIEKYNSNGIFSYDIDRDRLAVKCVGGYVLRHIEQQPKWLNLGAEYFINNRELFQTDKDIILTEDVISCIKASNSLSKVGIALLGIKPFDKLKHTLRTQIMASQGYIYIWLDDDIAGWKGALNLRRVLFDSERVKIIKYREPKLCNVEEINKIFDIYKNKC